MSRSIHVDKQKPLLNDQFMIITSMNQELFLILYQPEDDMVKFFSIPIAFIEDAFQLNDLKGQYGKQNLMDLGEVDFKIVNK